MVKETRKQRLQREMDRRLQEVLSTPQGRHSYRFRQIAQGYARRVAFAYDRDIEAAMRDDDPTVAARVRAWEIAQGLEPQNWLKIGMLEKEEDVRFGINPNVPTIDD